MFLRHPRMAGLLAGVLFAFSGAASAMDDAALGQVLEKRILGDGSGACLAAAVIEGDRVARAWRCADPADIGRVGPDVAFEIGSIAKTMTAILLADLILDGKASLDDRLSDHLPEGTIVPDHEGQPILLRHVVTHTSGLPALPPRMEVADPSDPYATLDADTLLASLGDVTLARAPGTRFEYSNFASMVLSLALARQAGTDFETLARQKVFDPLGMENAYVNRRPEGLRVAAGHLPGGGETAPWTFASGLAGAGGVRATLDDMVRYAQAQLGNAPQRLAEAIRLTQQPLETGAQQATAMNWMLWPLGDRLIHGHEGGTGGFASLLVFDPERGRAVVVLADAGLLPLGGLGDIGLHLFDDAVPLGQPRPAAQSGRPSAGAPTPSPEALRGYAGTYTLMPGFDLVVRERDGVLHAQATGQGEFPLEPVADDVFEAADHGIEIGFSRDDAGEVTKLELRQAGSVLSGERR